MLAYSTGGIPELIEDGRTGFLVNMRSPEALASRILEVLRTGTEHLSDIARNARDKWLADYRVETYQQQVCGIISETVQAFANPSCQFNHFARPATAERDLEKPLAS